MMKCLSLQSKMVLYVAIGGLFAFMGGIVYYSTFDIPELEKSEIELYSVEVIEVNNFENYISLKNTFLVKNFGEQDSYCSGHFVRVFCQWKIYWNIQLFGRGHTVDW